MVKDECGIRGRVLRVAYMRKCQRCKRLLCRDCTVPDVATGDPTLMLCLHCARRVVSPRSQSKYGGLMAHLKFRGAFTRLVGLSFARIDGLIGSNLPMSAYKEEAWWNNSPSRMCARVWLDAGWEVQEVNLKEGYLVFKRVRDARFKKRTKSKIDKPFKSVKVRSSRLKPPSETKISQLYARIKNLERQRTEERRNIRGLKPRR